MAVEQRTVFFPYASNGDFDAGSATATRAIISIHGLNGSAVTYRDNALSASSMVPGASESTFIIAPHFLRSGFITGAIEPGLVYWNASPNWGSNQALVGPGAETLRLSAFSVLDRIVDRLLDPTLFPALETIIFVGHSAGGQMVNRYAASSPRETIARQSRDVHFRYLVLAPSSYVYMDEKRAIPGSADQFAVPSTTCSGYNTYGYGLAQLFSYHASNGVNAATMRQQFTSRFIFYLVGSADSNPNDSDLDKSCQSMLQGTQRLERAIIHFNHVQSSFGAQINDLQTLSVAPSIGHSGRGLMTSPEGLKLIFGYDQSDSDRDGHTGWTEWVWGSDASNTQDRPSVTISRASPSSGVLSVAWRGRAHRLYRVLISSDLDKWQPASAWLEGANGPMGFDLDATGNSALFVKIEARLR